MTMMMMMTAAICRNVFGSVILDGQKISARSATGLYAKTFCGIRCMALPPIKIGHISFITKIHAIAGPVHGLNPEMKQMRLISTCKSRLFWVLKA